jgi:hypothetical protein
MAEAFHALPDWNTEAMPIADIELLMPMFVPERASGPQTIT